MKMNTRTLVLVIAMVGICTFSLTDAARAGFASKTAEEVFEFILKRGGREVTEELRQEERQESRRSLRLRSTRAENHS
jgi:hypothetical protein